LFFILKVSLSSIWAEIRISLRFFHKPIGFEAITFVASSDSYYIFITNISENVDFNLLSILVKFIWHFLTA